jgi:hypothetical protein
MKGLHWILSDPSRGGTNLEKMVAAARRSMVAVIAPGAGGSGWIALPNGVTVTTQAAVGCHTDVMLEYAERRRAKARVIAVDVPKDMAFVIPEQPPGLPYPSLLVRAEPAPRTGEAVCVLSASPGAGVGAAAGVVFLASDSAPRRRSYPMSAAARRCGEPVLDESGRVLGIIVAGEPPTSLSAAPPSPWTRPMLGAAQFWEMLSEFDRDPEELRHRGLVYHCPSCFGVFSILDDRCITCGVLLPHSWPSPPELSGAERVVRDALAAIGIIANKARIGPRRWRLLHTPDDGIEPAEITLCLHEDGSHIAMCVPLVRIPAANHEAFYRLLLTINDATAGPYRVSIVGDMVVLSLLEPTAYPGDRDLGEFFDDLIRLGAEYREALSKPFHAEPVLEGFPEA